LEGDAREREISRQAGRAGSGDPEGIAGELPVADAFLRRYALHNGDDLRVVKDLNVPGTLGLVDVDRPQIH
jgi:hypothetical protein